MAVPARSSTAVRRLSYLCARHAYVAALADSSDDGPLEHSEAAT